MLEGSDINLICRLVRNNNSRAVKRLAKYKNPQCKSSCIMLTFAAKIAASSCKIGGEKWSYLALEKESRNLVIIVSSIFSAENLCVRSIIFEHEINKCFRGSLTLWNLNFNPRLYSISAHHSEINCNFWNKISQKKRKRNKNSQLLKPSIKPQWACRDDR